MHDVTTRLLIAGYFSTVQELAGIILRMFVTEGNPPMYWKVWSTLSVRSENVILKPYKYLLSLS